jgi:hypothetical protein
MLYPILHPASPQKCQPFSCGMILSIVASSGASTSSPDGAPTAIYCIPTSVSRIQMVDHIDRSEAYGHINKPKRLFFLLLILEIAVSGSKVTIVLFLGPTGAKNCHRPLKSDLIGRCSIWAE